ncbi:MAG: right-handed parallel beta-helix repeat-containing protein [Arachidicoccus sp.]|nr:right-handed parallel beta-helix repeat-containing protein [Arachidicoccus sp.]
MIFRIIWISGILLFFVNMRSWAVDRHVYPGNSIQSQIDISSAGDQVIIHAGTYSQSISIINKSSLTIISAGDGEVVLMGSGSDTHTIYIENGTDITVSGFTVKNSLKAAWSTGITIQGYGSGFTISENKITDISYINESWNSNDNPSSIVGANGIAIIGNSENTPLSNINILNNEVSYCMTGWNEGISLKGNISNFNIQGNAVHHITNIGIDVLGLSTYPNLYTNNQPNNGTIKNNIVYNCICNYTDNGAIYLDGAINTMISNNKVYNNKYGITLGCENQINQSNASSTGLHIRNNLIYNNSLAGIMCGSNGVNNGSAEGVVSYSTIDGNTLIKNSSSTQWGSELVIQNANNIDCFSNVIYGQYTQMITIGANVHTLSFRANCYYNIASPTEFWASRQTSTNTWTSIDLATFKTLTNDTGSDQSIMANPLLMNPDINNPDPHLTAISPCIDEGKIDFATFSGENDYDGQERILNGRVDIGVDEYGNSTLSSSCPAITVDGSLSDWGSITPIATAASQSSLSLKIANNAQALYFAVSGNGMDSTQYQIFLNTDNDVSTGYTDNTYDSSGADYLIESGLLYKYDGGSGWSWTAVNASVQVNKNSDLTELGINRSEFSSLSSVITVAYKDMTNYVIQSKLPSDKTYATYDIINCQ